MSILFSRDTPSSPTLSDLGNMDTFKRSTFMVQRLFKTLQHSLM